jgi:hypothetical protein
MFWTSEFHGVMSVTFSAWKRCFVRLYLQWFVRLMYTMLPPSLDCPFLIAPSGFSNACLKCCWTCSHSEYSLTVRASCMSKSENVKTKWYILFEYSGSSWNTSLWTLSNNQSSKWEQSINYVCAFSNQDLDCPKHSYHCYFHVQDLEIW